MTYYLWKNGGRVLGIARVDGPVMQLLDSAGTWVDYPTLITSLQEPGKYEPVSESDAHAAARASGGDWM